MIPSAPEAETIARHLDTALLKKLEVRRFGDANRKKPWGKKVPAGQSYTQVNREEESSEEESSEEKSSKEESSKEESSEEETVDSELEEQSGNKEVQEHSKNVELPDLDTPSRKSGTSVIAVYEGQWFVAEVVQDQTSVPNRYTRLSYMVIKGSNSFAWGSKHDLMITLNEDIILDEEPVNRRGHFGLKKNDLAKVNSSMVVVYFPLFIYDSSPKGTGIIFIKTPYGTVQYLKDQERYSMVKTAIV